LIDLGSPASALPASAVAASDGGFVDLVVPGSELREDPAFVPFAAPDLYGGEGQSLALPLSCTEAAAADGAVRLALEAAGGTGPKQVRPGDVVGVVPSAPGASDLVLWARVEEVRDGGFVAAARVAANDPRAQWAGRRFDARLSFHSRLGTVADFFGLGMLLFRTLLVNDGQTIDDVAAAIGKCVRRVEDGAAGEVDGAVASARLQQLLGNAELRQRFEVGHVLQRRTDRERCGAQAGPPAIDAVIWRDVLRLGFRLVTKWRGFGFTEHESGSADAGLRHLVDQIDAVCRRLSVDLFQRADRDAAIAAVGGEVLEKLRAETDPRDERPLVTTVMQTPERFHLLLQREGESGAPQDLAFDRDRVTLGRREGDNVVRLADPMVSSQHAVIERREDEWVVIDRKSTNGTEVDGIRLHPEVPQPLYDGAVIVIRPFRLTFRTGVTALDATLAVNTITAPALMERLRSAFAAAAASPERREALRRVLLEARDAVGSRQLADRLEEALRATGGPVREDTKADLAVAAHRSLAQLSRTLVGGSEFATPEDVQAFAGKLARFVESTSGYIEGMLELRRVLGKHIEIGAATTASGRPAARTAAEVQQLLLGWAAREAVDAGGWFLAKFYDDVTGIIEGLLRGTQQVRRAVRERLDPDKLVAAAGQEARLGMLVNVAANSALWKLYVEAYREVTGGEEYEAEIDRLLQKRAEAPRPTES
jgi:pSer/pThr/pTyr-binding forkhead associated (FHA) protein